MKKYFKFLPVLFFGLCLVLNSCSKESESLNSNQNNVAKSSNDNISNILSSLDFAVQAKIENNNLSDEELSTMFINHLQSINGLVVEVDSSPTNIESMELSDDYWLAASLIHDVSGYSTSDDYKNALNLLSSDLSNYDLTASELTTTQGNISFMLAFVDYMESLSLQETAIISKSGDCDGWWSCWGKCAAGTIGGALTGGVAGCAALGGIGAAIGAAVTIWAGPGAAGGAGVGAAAGCIVGGAVGSIGGGLAGAAASCD
ncbi:MAG: hypothetical protein ACSHWW_02135 [Nonlabens sp.]|uniref:hypothetical protein n=1 Tax=Nonlabens sp. TaxID=1888209 RepID=UPI003EFA1D03